MGEQAVSPEEEHQPVERQEFSSTRPTDLHQLIGALKTNSLIATPLTIIPAEFPDVFRTVTPEDLYTREGIWKWMGKVTRTILERKRAGYITGDLEIDKRYLMGGLEVARAYEPDSPTTIPTRKVATSNLDRLIGLIAERHAPNNPSPYNISTNFQTELAVLSVPLNPLLLVVGNMLMNAIYHGKGRIKMTTDHLESKPKEGHFWRLAITNDGDVIPPKNQMIIFQYGTKATTDKTSPPGFGLWLAQEVVLSVPGATLGVESAGWRTTFSRKDGKTSYRQEKLADLGETEQLPRGMSTRFFIRFPLLS